MRLLVDTSVLIRFVDENDPLHPILQTCVSKLLAGGHDIGMTPQGQRKFWSVATRPAQMNGLGLTPAVAEDLLCILRSVFDFWDDLPGIATEWRRVVLSLDVKGVQVHDANHAAAAIVHRATYVLTFDKRDFDRFRAYGLTPISPFEV